MADETWDWAAVARSLTFHYQPIFGYPALAAIGHEALLRFVDGPFSTPLQAFDAARRVGMERELDRLCLETVFRTTPARAAGTLFVNVLPSTIVEGVLQSDDFVEWAEEGGFSPGRLVVEIVEQQHVADIDWLVLVADRLRDNGIGVAMDDCGDVPGTFAIAERLRPTYVKIARSIVELECEKPTGLLGDIARFATRVGAVPIAEGIETREQALRVGAAGVVLMQGFGLARPAPEFVPTVRYSESHGAMAEVAASILDAQAIVAYGSRRSGQWLDVACERRRQLALSVT